MWLTIGSGVLATLSALPGTPATPDDPSKHDTQPRECLGTITLPSTYAELLDEWHRESSTNASEPQPLTPNNPEDPATAPPDPTEGRQKPAPTLTTPDDATPRIIYIARPEATADAPPIRLIISLPPQLCAAPSLKNLQPTPVTTTPTSGTAPGSTPEAPSVPAADSATALGSTSSSPTDHQAARAVQWLAAESARDWTHPTPAPDARSIRWITAGHHVHSRYAPEIASWLARWQPRRAAPHWPAPLWTTTPPWAAMPDWSQLPSWSEMPPLRDAGDEQNDLPREAGNQHDDLLPRIVGNDDELPPRNGDNRDDMPGQIGGERDGMPRKVGGEHDDPPRKIEGEEVSPPRKTENDPNNNPPVTKRNQPSKSKGSIAAGAALNRLGTPFSWGGGSSSGPTTGIGRGASTVGFDCSGLTLYAWAKAGVKLGHYTGTQFDQGRRIPLSELQKGDLVFFGGGSGDPTHVGLYLGDGVMIHAPKTGDVVKKTQFLDSTYYRPIYRGAVRPG